MKIRAITTGFTLGPMAGLAALREHFVDQRRQGFRQSEVAVVTKTRRPYINVDGLPCLGSQALAENLAGLGLKRFCLDISQEKEIQKAATFLKLAGSGAINEAGLSDKYTVIKNINHNPGELAFWEDLADEDLVAGPAGKELPRMIVPFPRANSAVRDRGRLLSILAAAQPVEKLTPGTSLRETENSDLEIFERFLVLVSNSDLISNFGVSDQQLKVTLEGQCVDISVCLGLALARLGLKPKLLLFYYNYDLIGQTQAWHHLALGLRILDKFLVADHSASQFISHNFQPLAEALDYAPPREYEGSGLINPFIAPLDWLVFNHQHFPFYYQLAGVEDIKTVFSAKTRIGQAAREARYKQAGFIDKLVRDSGL